MAPPAKLHWRRYPDHCLGISGDPSAEHGRLLKLVDCANGTLLLVEEAVYNELGVGTGGRIHPYDPMQPAGGKELCLDAPDAFQLQFWPCAQVPPEHQDHIMWRFEGGQLRPARQQAQLPATEQHCVNVPGPWFGPTSRFGFNGLQLWNCLEHPDYFELLTEEDCSEGFAPWTEWDVSSCALPASTLAGGDRVLTDACQMEPLRSGAARKRPVQNKYKGLCKEAITRRQCQSCVGFQNLTAYCEATGWSSWSDWDESHCAPSYFAAATSYYEKVDACESEPVRRGATRKRRALESYEGLCQPQSESRLCKNCTDLGKYLTTAMPSARFMMQPRDKPRPATSKCWFPGLFCSHENTP